MKMQRRTFLRVLGSAMVGAVIAPSIVVEPLSPPNFWRSQATLGASPPLTLEMLRDAFNLASKGSAAPPNTIVTTRAIYERYASLARECGLVYDSDLAA